MLLMLRLNTLKLFQPFDCHSRVTLTREGFGLGRWRAALWDTVVQLAGLAQGPELSLLERSHSLTWFKDRPQRLHRRVPILSFFCFSLDKVGAIWQEEEWWNKLTLIHSILLFLWSFFPGIGKQLLPSALFPVGQQGPFWHTQSYSHQIV